MKNINRIYLDLIYQWNQKLIDEQNFQIYKNYKPLKTPYNGDNELLIYESTFFTKIDDVFEEWFIKQFEDLYQEILDQYKKTGDSYIEKYIKVADIANAINLKYVKNYMNFYNFIDTLKQSKGILTLKFEMNGNGYEPPEEWLEEKIRIVDRDLSNFTARTFNLTAIDKAGKQYQDYMIQLTNKCQTLNARYKLIKQNILNQVNFGSIIIDMRTLSKERYKFKNSIIWHEFGHFWDYLIKINNENWEIGKMYRSGIIHNDYLPMNILDKTEQTNYWLDEQEFKRLAGTYIEQLHIVFNENCKDNKDKKQIFLFFEVLMNTCQIPIHYSNIKPTNERYQTFSKALNKIFDINDIISFFSCTYKDSILPKENNHVRNRWTVLKRWLKGEFFKYSI